MLATTRDIILMPLFFLSGFLIGQLEEPQLPIASCANIATAQNNDSKFQLNPEAYCDPSAQKSEFTPPRPIKPNQIINKKARQFELPRGSKKALYSHQQLKEC